MASNRKMRQFLVVLKNENDYSVHLHRDWHLTVKGAKEYFSSIPRYYWRYRGMGPQSVPVFFMTEWYGEERIYWMDDA